MSESLNRWIEIGIFQGDISEEEGRKVLELLERQ